MQISHSEPISSNLYNNLCYFGITYCTDTSGAEYNNLPASSEYKSTAISDDNITRYNISPFVTTHFVSPEPILYVDISSKNVEGDLPEKNILRIKPDSSTFAH